MHDTIIIRNYYVTDHDEVVKLFDANSPEYFSQDERQGFIHYLRHEIEHYFIIELNGIIVGAGGVNLENDGSTGIISWGMIHPGIHRQSLGSQLLQHRIDFLKKLQVKTITVRTSQLTKGFFDKHGFVLIEVVKDYWAKGFDLYRMELGEK